MKTTTEMQLVPITKLVPYVNNARTHSPEQITKLRSSLREFGFINPVIIDRAFNVIAGHGRHIRFGQVFAVEAAARHRIGHVAAQLPVGRAGVHIRAACPVAQRIDLGGGV